MKVSGRHQINSQILIKKQNKKTKSRSVTKEALQPATLSSYIQIPLKKEEKDLLVAENDELSIIVIKTILDKHNFTFDIVSSEEDAISAFEKCQYHIVLIGLNDSHFLWESLISKIWDENRDTPKTFLLALTTPPNDHAVSEYLKNNFDKIILKPYKETELIKIIRKYKRLTPKRKLPLNHTSFNLDQLKRISNNNEDFVKSMLDKFIESAIECAETMTAALAEKNIDKFKKAAHKGLSSYSILELKELMAHLMYFDKHEFSESDISDLKHRLKDFNETNNSVIKDIKKYLE